MKNKNKLILIGIIILVLIVLFVSSKKLATSSASNPSTTTASVEFVNTVITGSGSVVAQNQATINFQIGGKLVYLPLKAGDKVYAGEAVAKLDTYALQRSLSTALNNYRSARDVFEQAQENAGDNVLKTQINPTYLNVNSIDSTTAVNEAIARIADENQNALDNSVANVELANYALQLSTLYSPLTGILIHEDVSVPNINVTPITSFTVADPSSMVFRANIPTQKIYYISEGSPVSIAVDGIQDKMDGAVVRIYPSKVTLPSGEAVYQVDIESDQLKKLAKLDETGNAIISTNSKNVALVPVWTVLAGKYIWIDNSGTPELKEVTAGKVHGNKIEITSGLSPSDKIIIDPKFISSLKYKLL